MVDGWDGQVVQAGSPKVHFADCVEGSAAFGALAPEPIDCRHAKRQGNHRRHGQPDQAGAPGNGSGHQAAGYPGCHGHANQESKI